MPVYWIYFIQFSVVYILMTWAFYLPMRAGQMYNGPIYCMAIGGYSAAFLCGEVGLPFGVALLCAVALAALFGFLPAVGLSRTSALPTAVASLALIFIIQGVISNLDFVGGASGYVNIPRVGYLLPVSIAALVLVGGLIFRIDHSRLGLIMDAISAEPERAATLGVNRTWIWIWVQTMSAVISAVAGVIYAFTLRVIFPETYGFSLLMSTWTILFVGGRYSMWGVVVIAPVVWGLSQWIPQSVSQLSNVFYAAFLILVILFRPEGLIDRRLLRFVTEGVSAAFSHVIKRRKPVEADDLVLPQ